MLNEAEPHFSSLDQVIREAFDLPSQFLSCGKTYIGIKDLPDLINQRVNEISRKNEGEQQATFIL